MTHKLKIIDSDLLQGFIEYEREIIRKEQNEVLADLETVSCENRRIDLEGRLACLSGQMSMLIMCEQTVHNLMAEEDRRKTVMYIHNPVTGKYYPIRTRTTEYGKRGQIKGLWSSKHKG